VKAAVLPSTQKVEEVCFEIKLVRAIESDPTAWDCSIDNINSRSELVG
jgi:hypothetical protein